MKFTSSPSVSVVMATYNGKTYLSEQLQSVFSELFDYVKNGLGRLAEFGVLSCEHFPQTVVLAQESIEPCGVV